MTNNCQPIVNCNARVSKAFVWKSVQAVQFIVDRTGSGYDLFALNRPGNY